MTRVTRHLPALSTLGAQLQENASWHAGSLQASLHALHDGVTAVEWSLVAAPADFQAARAKLGVDASVVKDRAARALEEGDAFLRRSSSGATRLGPALADFLAEFRALEKMVDRCGEWQQQLDETLERERRDASGHAAASPPAGLAQRAAELRSRLALLQAVDRSARNVHALADNLANTQPKLLDALEGKIRPSCLLLGARADHILQAGAPSARAAATLASARSDAQIWVTQGMSLALRVHAAQERLVREAAALRHRCGLMLPQAAQDLDRLDGTPLQLRRGADETVAG